MTDDWKWEVTRMDDRKQPHRGRLFQRLPWPLIAGVELVLILALAAGLLGQIFPRDHVVSRSEGYYPIMYKFQDPKDTDGSNYYMALCVQGERLTVVEITSDIYKGIVECSEDVLFHASFDIYDSGRIEMTGFDTEDVWDRRPKDQQNSPQPDS